MLPGREAEAADIGAEGVMDWTEVEASMDEEGRVPMSGIVMGVVFNNDGAFGIRNGAMLAMNDSAGSECGGASNNRCPDKEWPRLRGAWMGYGAEIVDGIIPNDDVEGALDTLV